MTGLRAALEGVPRERSVVTLGGRDVVRLDRVTPAHAFTSIVAETGDGHAVELTARDSFDARLAAFLLESVAAIALPKAESRTIRVVPAASPSPWAFDAIVVVPPAVANRFEHESALLRQKTYWVVPAFDGEFQDHADGSVFWHQLERKDGWRSVVVRWDRSRKTKPRFDDS